MAARMGSTDMLIGNDSFNDEHLSPEGNPDAIQTFPSRSLTSLSQQQTTPFRKMLAACSGAIITSIFTTPLDVVKTRLQSQQLFKPPPLSDQLITKCCRDLFFSSRNMPHDIMCQVNPYMSSRASSLSCTYPSIVSREVTARKLNGTLDGVVKIVRYEGITSLWRGLSPALVMSVPATVIYFVGYEHLRDAIWARWKGKQSEKYAPLFAGAIARTVAATVISPIELFRTRLQGPQGTQGLRKVMNGVQMMVRTHGLPSLWRGLGPTLWRDVPFSAIYWAFYEIFKRRINNYTNGRLNGFEVAFVSGATSGMIAAILTTPFDVAKTRRQIALNSMKNPNMLRIMRTIAKEEGYAGLMRGVVPRVGKVAPACAIMISSYVFFTSPKSP